MKSERKRTYKKSQTIKNKPDNKKVTLLLSMVKENNIKLDKLDKELNKIDEDINSNPFTKLFKVKGKTFWKYFIALLITVLIMSYIYILWINWVYDWKFSLANTLEILGNGFYWIVAGMVYWFISRIFKKEIDSYARFK